MGPSRARSGRKPWWVECPTLVVHGEADPIPWEFGNSSRIASQAKLVVIPEASHFPFVEARAAFLQAIEEFRSV